MPQSELSFQGAQLTVLDDSYAHVGRLPSDVSWLCNRL